MTENDLQSQVITPELVEKASKVLESSLKATQRVRAGRGEYEDVDDYKVQLKAAEIIVSYHLGKPTSKNLNLSLTAGDQEPGQVSSLDAVRRMLANGVDFDSIIQAEQIEEPKDGENEEAIDI